MALIIKDRVQEYVNTAPGLGAVTLGGAVPNFVAFGSVMANADTCYYAIVDASNWEVGLATYTLATNSLARTTVYASSNGGALVNFTALPTSNSRFMYLDAVADRVLMKDAANAIPSPTFSGTIAGTPLVATNSSLASQIVTVNFGAQSFDATYATTAASGTGTTATLTFSPALPVAPAIGTAIIVTGVTPVGYNTVGAGSLSNSGNGTAIVTASTTTTVSYASTATGVQTVAGLVQIGSWVPAYSQSFSVALSTALYNATTYVTGTAYGVAQPIVYAGNPGASINANTDEFEMDNFTVAASLGTSPNINVSVVATGPIVGPRQIALKLF